MPKKSYREEKSCLRLKYSSAIRIFNELLVMQLDAEDLIYLLNDFSFVLKDLKKRLEHGPVKEVHLKTQSYCLSEPLRVENDIETDPSVFKALAKRIFEKAGLSGCDKEMAKFTTCLRIVDVTPEEDILANENVQSLYALFSPEEETAKRKVLDFFLSQTGSSL